MDAHPFSDRTRWDVTPNRLARRHAEILGDGETIIDLTESNPTRCAFDYPAGEILAALSSPASMVYAPDPCGLRSARESVARFQTSRGLPGIEPEQIVLCSGTSEAYSWLMKLLCNPGDEILIPVPGYPLLDFIAQAEGVHLAHYTLEYDGRWTPNLPAIAASITPRTRAVIVVQPNNPTGSYLSEGELAELGALCEARGLALISDEVFRDYPFEGPPDAKASALSLRGPLVFTLGGLSKAVGLPQLKLSWIVTVGKPEQVAGAIGRLDVLGDTFLPVNTPVQCALPRILEVGISVQEAILRRVRANRRCVRSLVRSDSAWECLAADGGWYSILRLPRLMSDEEWALDLLERERVYLHPGHFFDFAIEGCLVVSLLPQEELFHEGIGRVVRHIAARTG